MNQEKKKRLLVIDDDNMILSSISAYMEDYGYDVMRADDGDKGLDIFEKKRPDVVLLDLRMPNLDGLDVLAHITAKSQDTPVIVISGTGFIQDAIESLRRGAYDFILKPVTDLAIIKHSVDRALERVALLEENRRHKSFLEEQVKTRTADLEKQTVELLHAKEAAEAASRAKSGFLSTMSHELRTPMNGILGTAQLLQESTLNPDQTELVEIMMRSSNALMKILNEILDLSKIEANSIEIESIDFNPLEIIRANINLFSSAANVKGLDLTWNEFGNLPKGLVGDPHRLGQILSNLLGNAVKFTENGSIRITTTSVKTSAESVTLHIDITDTGIGISEEKSEEVFQPFFQVDNSISRKFGGTGLGLTIVKNMVELMGGQVKVVSKQGSGSTFSLRIPFKISTLDAQAQQETNSETETSPATKPNDNSIRNRNRKLNRLLVVEDDIINQMVIVGMLEKMGFQVDVASNGKEALVRFQQEKYDLVFMDCLMPEMDGFEATRQIRRVEKESALHNETPIIAFTAKAMQGDRELCLSAGMNNYMTKPVTFEKLTSMLSTI